MQNTTKTILKINELSCNKFKKLSVSLSEETQTVLTKNVKQCKLI